MNDALNNLQQELDRTAVISNDFKKWIMSWALAAASEAYAAGKKDERGEPGYWRIMPRPGSDNTDCYPHKYGSREAAYDAARYLSANYVVRAFSAAGKMLDGDA